MLGRLVRLAATGVLGYICKLFAGNIIYDRVLSMTGYYLGLKQAEVAARLSNWGVWLLIAGLVVYGVYWFAKWETKTEKASGNAAKTKTPREVVSPVAVFSASTASRNLTGAVDPPLETPFSGSKGRIAIEKLFSVDSLTGDLILKFSPDSKTVKADAVLLILLGFKELLGFERVSAAKVRTAFKRSPLKRDSGESILSHNALLSSQDSVSHVVSDYLVGSVLHGGLATGEYFSLTQDGYVKAYGLARDLIAKAS